MKSSKSLLSLTLFLFFSIGLSGCIFSADPDPNETIYLNLGEKVILKVKGLVTPLNPTMRYVWVVKRDRDPLPITCFQSFDGTACESAIYDRSGVFEFIAGSEAESNIIKISCTVWQLTAAEITIPGSGSLDGSSMFGYFWAPLPPLPLSTRQWTIMIRQEPPIWLGDYHIWDESDIQSLSGFTEISGNLYIDNTNLEDLEGLDQIISIGGELIIANNELLTSSIGLTGLASVGGGVYIRSNDSLVTLGLNSLCNVGVHYEESQNSCNGNNFCIFLNPNLCTNVAEELISQVGSCSGSEVNAWISGTIDCPLP